MFIGLVLMFLGSSGVAVFEHECTETGRCYGFFSNVEHNCEQKHETACSIEQKDSCCKMVLEIPDDVPKLEEECCSTQVSLLKVNDAFISTDNEVTFFNPNFIVAVAELSIDSHYDTGSISNKSPPKLNISVAQQRARLQVYLI